MYAVLTSEQPMIYDKDVLNDVATACNEDFSRSQPILYSTLKSMVNRAPVEEMAEDLEKMAKMILPAA